MSAILNGPRVRERVKRGIGDDWFGINYAYVTDTGKTCAGVRASLVRIRVYLVDMGESMDELERRVASVDGCVSTRQVVGHPTLRSMVEAMFNG